MKLYNLYPKKLVDLCYYSVFHRRIDQGKTQALALGFDEVEFWQLIELIRSFPKGQ